LLFFLELCRPTTHFAGQLGLFARGSVKPATTAAKPDELRAYIYYYSRALLTPTHPPPIDTALPLPSVIVFVLLAPGAALRRSHPTPPPPLTPPQPKPLPFTFAPKIYPSTSSHHSPTISTPCGTCVRSRAESPLVRSDSRSRSRWSANRVNNDTYKLYNIII